MKSPRPIGPILGFALLFLFQFPAEVALAEIRNPYRQQADLVESAKEVVQANPESSDAQFNLGNALIRAGRPDEATTPLAEAIRLRPDMKQAYLLLGSVYDRQRHYVDEVELYKKAVEQFSGSDDLLKLLAAAYSRDRRFEEAIETQRQVIQLKPQDSAAYTTLASYTCKPDTTARRSTLRARRSAWIHQMEPPMTISARLISD